MEENNQSFFNHRRNLIKYRQEVLALEKRLNELKCKKSPFVLALEYFSLQKTRGNIDERPTKTNFYRTPERVCKEKVEKTDIDKIRINLKNKGYSEDAINRLLSSKI